MLAGPVKDSVRCLIGAAVEVEFANVTFANVIPKRVGHTSESDTRADLSYYNANITTMY